MNHESNHPASIAPDDEQGIDIFAILRTVRKRWMSIAAITLAISLAVTFYSLGQTKIYEAQTMMLFDPNPPRPLGRQVETVVDMGNNNYWNNQEYYETQYRLLKSLRLGKAVVEALGLQHDLAFLQMVPADGKTVPMDPMPSVEDAAQILVNRVTVTPVKDSRLATVAYQDADPARAQRIVMTLAETFVAFNLSDAQQSTSTAVDWLNSQLDKLKEGLDSSELALHEYKLDKKILSTDLDAQSNILREEMQQLSSALTAARIKREELAARHGELAKVNPEDPSDLPATELLQSSVLQRLRTEYINALRERDALLATGKGINHPDVRAAEGNVATNRAAVIA
ncbi:MAG TPA: Wzz/FepE/Etk N-terminal domain-containing protein, partial [Polyangiaceae bacterium]|nr:Wzz/FepE/Etk N-terminal domain-containing protein [Polyangiaceae bacterium]